MNPSTQPSSIESSAAQKLECPSQGEHVVGRLGGQTKETPLDIPLPALAECGCTTRANSATARRSPLSRPEPQWLRRACNAMPHSSGGGRYSDLETPGDARADRDQYGAVWRIPGCGTGPGRRRPPRESEGELFVAGSSSSTVLPVVAVPHGGPGFFASRGGGTRRAGAERGPGLRRAQRGPARRSCTTRTSRPDLSQVPGTPLWPHALLSRAVAKGARRGCAVTRSDWLPVAADDVQAAVAPGDECLLGPSDLCWSCRCCWSEGGDVPEGLSATGELVRFTWRGTRRTRRRP